MNCLQCGLETSNNKFCSRSCSATFNNIGRIRSIENNRICGNCEFKKTKTKHHQFCSDECLKSFRLKKLIKNFNEGKLNSPLSIKKCIVELRGNICSVCFQNTIWNGKKLTLQLDHIDGNSDNNIPDNLRLLCPNCHSQTSTFAGYSRSSRKDTKRNKYLQKYKS